MDGNTKMIRWLHLSDLHLNREGIDNALAREKLLQYLKGFSKKIDYIFITGDFIYAPSGEADVDFVVSFLREVCSVTDVSIPNVFIVPGNHDIKRDDDKRKKAQKKLFGNRGYYRAAEGIIKEDDRKLLYAGKIWFNELVTKFYEDYPDIIQKYGDNSIIHFVRSDSEVNIVHVDTTISYCSHKERDLYIGTNELHSALKEIDRNKTTFLLTHYSFDYISRDEQKYLLEILKKYNIRLWLAGHEHEELARMQRDFFYEFMSGGGINDGMESRISFLIGEYDISNSTGQVMAYAWYSPKGWNEYPFFGASNDKHIYKFNLFIEKASNVDGFTKSLESLDYREISEGNGVINLLALNKDNVNIFSEAEMRFQLGSRASRKADFKEIQELFLAEVNMTLNSKKRENCMPLFRKVVRNSFNGFLYLDRGIMPFSSVAVFEFYYEDYEYYIIKEESFSIGLYYQNGKMIEKTFYYDYSNIINAKERLVRYRKLREYVTAKKATINVPGESALHLSFEIDFYTKEWTTCVYEMNSWIDLMLAVSDIEDFYGIQLVLPKKLSEKEKVAITVLHDAISGKECWQLPPVKVEKHGDDEKLTIESEMDIGRGFEFEIVHLLGYNFKPIRQYILPCQCIWDNDKSAWTVEGKTGIPVSFEFDLSYDEDLACGTLQIVEFNEDEINKDEVKVVVGDDSDFLKNYILLISEFQIIRKLFLEFYNQVKSFVNMYSELQSESNSLVNFEKSISINSLTDEMAYTGNDLIRKMGQLLTFLGLQSDDQFFKESYGDNLGFSWMSLMHEVYRLGILPIIFSNEYGVFFYDCVTLSQELKSRKRNELVDLIELHKTEMPLLDNERYVEYYTTCRNFLYKVGERYLEYYNEIGGVLATYVSKLIMLANDNPELGNFSDKYDDCIIFGFEEEKDEVHVLPVNENILADYTRFKGEAEKFLESKRLIFRATKIKNGIRKDAR